MNLPSIKISTMFALFGAGLFSSSCLHSDVSLKDAYAGDFLIGTILAGGIDGEGFFSEDPNEWGLVGREFNALTAENCMKPLFVQPNEGEFDFDASDYCVKFAEERGMSLIGHTLVWHSMSPEWIFKDANGLPAGRDLMLERMRTHIHTVVGRYKGRIPYWDVVNEAVVTNSDDQPASYRQSPWFNALGENYVEYAFRFAHEADPEAKLYYNDFSMTKKAKVDFVVDMVSKLRAKGVPIHGVGLQGHWHLDWPSLSEIEYALRSFADAGIPISITELDITVLPNAHGHTGANVSDDFAYEAKLNPYSESIPDAVLQAQATRYREVFQLFLKYKSNIERVTFWGTTDASSWKNDFPMKGRTDYPLLFDRSFNPKPAYQSLIELSDEN
jgi:endo-1,4-beta-xylanase